VTTDQNGAGYSVLVAQASGMVAVQAKCDTAAAIARMQQLARDSDSTLEEIARLVVDREIDFEDRTG
jgi:AmiR/NasT family two-component response regulator